MGKRARLIGTSTSSPKTLASKSVSGKAPGSGETVAVAPLVGLDAALKHDV